MSGRVPPHGIGIPPDLGVSATVVMDRETHGPTIHEPGLDLERIDAEELLVSNIDIVSHWSLHVALYALQNPTPENIQRALYLIGTSGDCEEHTDDDTLMPLPVSEPNGWGSPPTGDRS